MKVIYNSEPDKIVLLDARKVELVSEGLNTKIVNSPSALKSVKVTLQNITLQNAQMLLCKDVIDLTPYQSVYPNDSKTTGNHLTSSSPEVDDGEGYPTGEEYEEAVHWFNNLDDAAKKNLENMYAAFYHACMLASNNISASAYYLGDFRRRDIANIKDDIAKISNGILPSARLI